MVKFEAFKQSLGDEIPPPGLPPLINALWHAGHGDWQSAHEIAQDVHDRDGSWIHAYLHRKEGDLANAGYWYNRAGRRMPTHSLEEEWDAISRELLAK